MRNEDNLSFLLQKLNKESTYLSNFFKDNCYNCNL